MKRSGRVIVEVAEKHVVKTLAGTHLEGEQFVIDAKDARRLAQEGKVHYVRAVQPRDIRRRVEGRNLLTGGLDRAIVGTEHGHTR